ALGIALGIAFGYLAYYLGGWFFNLRIKWSKGEPNKEKARFIYLYTLLVPGFLHLLFTISSFIIDPKPFISETDVSIKELIQGFVLILANFYSVYVSYIGATTAFNPRKGLAILWFLFLPMLFYALALLAFVGLILLMAMKDI
ncbi:MAG: hypothetical protein OEZ36_04335, partial [Spirochaetota bacterium]|nr:hypothetical protein [Spirochaetota bacterium]